MSLFSFRSSKRRLGPVSKVSPASKKHKRFTTPIRNDRDDDEEEDNDTLSDNSTLDSIQLGTVSRK